MGRTVSAPPPTLLHQVCPVACTPPRAHAAHVSASKFYVNTLEVNNGPAGAQGTDYAQEYDETRNECREPNEPADERELVVLEEIGQLRHARGRGVDKRELAPDNLRAVGGVRWIETVLLEAPRAEVRAWHLRRYLEPCTVDRRALQAFAPVRVRRLRFGQEAPNCIGVGLVDEETAVEGRVIDLERARAGKV